MAIIDVLINEDLTLWTWKSLLPSVLYWLI